MSIKADIIDNVVTTLKTITTVNNYNQDVGLVTSKYLKSANETGPDDFPPLYVVDDNEDKDDGDASSRMIELSLIVTGYIKRANDQDDVQGRRRNLENDVEKALMVDDTRGGKAIKSDIDRIVTDKGIFDGFSIFEMTVNIRFYHDRRDPSSQANSPF